MVADLERIAAWLVSPEDVRLWAGPRVSYPLNLALLPQQIQWENSASLSVVESAAVVAFGQIVSKPERRLHLARLIVSSSERGKGHGRFLATALLERALASRPSAVSLNVAADNHAALSLYRSLRFTEASRPPDEAPGTSIYMQLAAQPCAPADVPAFGVHSLNALRASRRG